MSGKRTFSEDDTVEKEMKNSVKESSQQTKKKKGELLVFLLMLITGTWYNNWLKLIFINSSIKYIYNKVISTLLDK